LKTSFLSFALRPSADLSSSFHIPNPINNCCLSFSVILFLPSLSRQNVAEGVDARFDRGAALQFTRDLSGS
jgi:hypothetical protein